MNGWYWDGVGFYRSDLFSFSCEHRELGLYLPSTGRVEDVAREKNAIDILNERYAKGEIAREEYNRMKAEISEGNQRPRKVAYRE